MADRRITVYEVLVYIAYGYFFLIGLAWFLMSFSAGFNYTAFAIMAIFGAQAYFKHRLTNLIIGILMLGFCLFMVLQSLQLRDVNGFVFLIVSSVLGVLASLILIFSYTKFSFRNE